MSRRKRMIAKETTKAIKHLVWVNSCNALASIWMNKRQDLREADYHKKYEFKRFKFFLYSWVPDICFSYTLYTPPLKGVFFSGTTFPSVRGSFLLFFDCGYRIKWVQSFFTLFDAAMFFMKQRVGGFLFLSSILRTLL